MLTSLIKMTPVAVSILKKPTDYQLS